MTTSNRRWFPVLAVLCASSVCLTGCKSFSWSKLPGMSYFASDDKPAQSYYGSQDTPSNDYNASTVDYSQRYGNTGNTTAQSTYGQQYESTNVGNTNYLTNQPGQQAQGQNQPPQQPLYGQQQPQQQPLYGQQQYGNQAATYPAQAPQQYQPQGQNFNVAGPNQKPPTAGTLQEPAGNYNGGGFYNPNANVGSYQPNQTSESPKVPTYGAKGTEQTQGAAAYVSGTPANTQFDGGNYQSAGGSFQPNGNTTTPMPAYRPGSTGGTNGYYTPNGGSFNGQ